MHDTCQNTSDDIQTTSAVCNDPQVCNDVQSCNDVQNEDSQSHVSSFSDVARMLDAAFNDAGAAQKAASQPAPTPQPAHIVDGTPAAPATPAPLAAPGPLSSGATIAVIDGNSLMHRAFHAVRQPMVAPDGRATNALLGFFNMLIKMYRTFTPNGIICAFDKGKPQIRIDMYEKYKAQRPPMDPSLHEQFPMVKELLSALNIPVCELAGWEGDDILGTLAKQGSASGFSMMLFTGDRDIYQLASDSVTVVSTKKGVTDVAMMTPEDVDDLYHGITPQLVPDFYGLKGDTSDNIPGVPGIGPKRAAQLIVQYGNLEAVLAHADEVPGKMGESLLAHIDDARLSKKLATIRTDAPLDFAIERCAFPNFDCERVAQAFLALGFTSLTTKLIHLDERTKTMDIAGLMARHAKALRKAYARQSIAAAAHAAVSSDDAAKDGNADNAAQDVMQHTTAKASDSSGSDSSCRKEQADASLHNAFSAMVRAIAETVRSTAEIRSSLETHGSDAARADAEQIKQQLARTSSDAAACMSQELPVLYGDEAKREVMRAAEAGEYIGIAHRLHNNEDTAAQTLFSLTLQLSLACATSKALCVFCNEAAYEVVCELISSHARMVTSDAKQLFSLVYPADSWRAARIDYAAVAIDAVFDTQLAAYLLNSDAASYDVDELLMQYAGVASYPQQPIGSAAAHGFATDDDQKALSEMLACAKAQRVLQAPLMYALMLDESYDVYCGIELPLICVLLDMERTGLHVDTDILHEQSMAINREINHMLATLHTDIGETINIDSPMQLSHVLFDVWQLPTKGLKKTKRGYFSTNAKTLETLSKQDDRVQLILDYRERAKLKSTYLDALPAQIKPDGRIHTTFNQTVAATGRLSSSDPNLQNIPTRSQLGHRVRKAFTVADDSVFLTCDYSQIELRLLAHLSQDPHLIAAFNSGADFHAATASRIFGIEQDAVTPQLRSRAKAVNFGIVYGQQAFGLASSLKISRATAKEMIDKYFEVYPCVREFLDESVAFARAHGYVPTMYGRKRHIEHINASNFQLRSFAERTAMNHPMQGSAADIIKLAMIEVETRLRASSLRAHLVLQIHDELDFEVATADCDALSELVKDAMEHVVSLRVPLIADISYANNWADAK